LRASASGSAWARSCSPAAAKAIARQPSTKARMVVSMRRTSAWWMIGALAGSEPSTGRLCTRSLRVLHRLLVGALGHARCPGTPTA
jgi:hypothetical protein